MEKILLIVTDFNLRQLYHELLFSKNIEVVPISSISSAMVFLSLEDFPIIVIRVDENISEIEVFLDLRKRHSTWLKSKIFLLSSNLNLKKNLSPKDLILNTKYFPPSKSASRIRSEIYK